MRKNIKQWIFVLGISFLFTSSIFLIHYILPGIINVHTYANTSFVDISKHLDHYFVEHIVEYHSSHPAFIRRPLVTGMIEIVHQVLKVSYAYSFIAVNFFALFLCGVLIYYISRTFDFTHIESIWSIILFYTSFTILLAFTLEISTYDDIVQYILIWLTLLYIYKQKWYYALATFFLALWSRETTLLLIPGFLLFFYPYTKKFRYAIRTDIFKIIVYGGSIISLVYIVVLYSALHYFGIDEQTKLYIVNSRFSHILWNFQNPQESLLSFISVVYALGIPTVLLMLYMKKQIVSAHMRRVIYAFLIILIINTIVVFISARTREARLLALPLVFVWPFLGHVARVVYKDIHQKIYTLRSIKYNIYMLLYVCVALFLVGASYVFCFMIFQPHIAIELSFWFRLYIFLFLVCIIIYNMIIQLSQDNI